jgi:hypothetical protein
MDNETKAYLFVFDPASFGGTSVQQLNEYVKFNRDIDRWWTFLPTCYAFLSKLDLATMNDMFQSFFARESVTFILTPVDPVQLNGFLPGAAWAAFKSDIESPFIEARKK